MSASTLLRRAAVVLALASLTATAACGPIGSDGDGDGEPAQGDVRPGGELRVALAQEPDILDPTLARTLVGRVVFNAICEKLYDVDADLNLVPQLAAALPEVAADGLSMTIPIREDAIFADGTPLNAEAVKSSLDRHTQLEGSARAAELASVDSVDIVDDFTVQINLNAQFSPLTSVLADRAGMILSPTAVAEKGEDFGLDPVCVGPFKFENRVAQDRIEVVKDPNYYDADNVFLDKVTYRIIADAATRFNNLLSGDVEVIGQTAPTDVAALEAESDLTLITSDSLGYQGLTINVGNANGVTEPPGELSGDLASPLSRDPVVRRALELSLNREALVETVFLGQFSPACGPISPASPLSSEEAQTCRDNDPTAAQDLLDRAGIETPVRFEMMIDTDAQARRLGEAIQAQAAEGGFEIVLAPTEFSAALDLADQGQYQAFAIGWSGRIDPDSNIASFLTTQAPLNMAGYSNPEADQLIADARAATDEAERRRLYGQLQQVVQEDLPIIYLYRQKNLTGVSNRVAGVEVYGDGLLRFAHAGFVEE